MLTIHFPRVLSALSLAVQEGHLHMYSLINDEKIMPDSLEGVKGSGKLAWAVPNLCRPGV